MTAAAILAATKVAIPLIRRLVRTVKNRAIPGADKKRVVLDTILPVLLTLIHSPETHTVGTVQDVRQVADELVEHEVAVMQAEESPELAIARGALATAWHRTESADQDWVQFNLTKPEAAALIAALK